MSIFNHFKHLSLSPDQETALMKLEAFLDSLGQVLMLKGYAGSGKTNILKGLVEYLHSIEKDFVFIAPIAVIDIEYKSNGFFGRVVPIKNLTNSLSLVLVIQIILQNFKQEGNVI